ncbi:MAG: hypothetical protein HYZ00_06645, partial [Candidatus Hydrogenedentes bacterium]|nr:hypothetical protein [Candidatus Hydrogenedentota bacterium]
MLWAPQAGYAADANELYAIGAVQKGMGGAGVASPQDATWVLLNPAAIVDLEPRIDVIQEFLRVELESRPRGIARNPFAGELHDSSIVPITSLGVVWEGKHGTFGFGGFGMEGNKADFPSPRTIPGLLGNGDRRSGYEVGR